MRGHERGALGQLAPLDRSAAGDLAPFLRGDKASEAREAVARGVALLVDASLLPRLGPLSATAAVWSHPFAAWAMARTLAAHADAALPPARFGVDVTVEPHVVVYPGVVVGDRVRLGASCVVGSPGFGWATGPGGERVHVPQLGGVVIEDDAWVGALSTVDAGTLGPTVIGRGVKLDAQVHVGHNVSVGEGSVVAAQSGFAGSVTIGRRVLVGGQVGVADHVTVGDDARLAAKSGVISDVPAGAVFGGYPAVARGKWLRGLARLYRRGNE